MEIEIDPKKLIDSPYSKEFNDLFQFNQNEINDFIDSINAGNHTCYLVSGYRGVGKTSFIRKVENALTDIKSDIVFVHVNFATFKSQSHLIRRLIRALFLKVDSSQKYQDLNGDDDNVKYFKERFNLLYHRTFKDVSQVSDEKSIRE